MNYAQANLYVPRSSYHSKENGEVILGKAAAVLKAALDGGLTSADDKPLLSMADALAAYDATAVATLLLLLSWVPSHAMGLGIADEAKRRLGENIDLVQPVSSSLAASGKLFYTLEVLDVLLKHIDGMAPHTEKSPMFVLDAGPINTMNASAYEGAKSNERSDHAEWVGQVNAAMRHLVDLMVTNFVAGGCNVVAHTGVARMLCGCALRQPGVVVPLSAAGDGYEILYLPLMDRQTGLIVSGHLRRLGECMIHSGKTKLTSNYEY